MSKRMGEDTAIAVALGLVMVALVVAYTVGRIVGRERALAGQPAAPAVAVDPKGACTIGPEHYDECLKKANACICTCKPAPEK